MTQGFTKLFASITESTVWIEPYATRIVWIAMMAKADAKGRVFASIPGLAKVAGVTLDECEEALRRFKSPDPYSRTPDYEGRRIEDIDGGWRLLNHAKYRELRDQDDRREYQARWARQRRERDKQAVDTTSTRVDTRRQCRPPSTQAEAEAEEEREERPSLELGAPEPVGGKRRRPRPRQSQTAVPTDFDLSADETQWALSRLGNEAAVQRESEKFLNHHQSKGSRFVDWHAAWRNWILKAETYGEQQR